MQFFLSICCCLWAAVYDYCLPLSLNKQESQLQLNEEGYYLRDPSNPLPRWKTQILIWGDENTNKMQ
jgi:hypothetical protein